VTSTSPSNRRSIRSVFIAALLRVLAVWILGAFVVLAGTAKFAPGFVQAAAWITAISGIVSVLALLPGILIGSDSVAPSNRPVVFMVACLAAMTIRIVGTVALLVVCGYQMHIPLQALALFVCGWYLLLTAVEIIWLAKGSSQFNTQAATFSMVDSPAVSHTTIN
jgi:hypothetical protein